MKGKKQFLTLLVICFLGLTLMAVGCSNADQTENKQELKIAVGEEFRVEDVWSHKGFNCLTYESLVTYDKEGKIVPLLADSWEIEQGGKVYTFHLRKGIKFSDGAPLNAGAVKNSFECMLKDSPEEEKRTPVKSINVVDEHTVSYVLKYPYALFLSEMARSFNPGAIVRPSPEAKITPYVGTGPFKLDEYVQTQYWSLVKNDNYWQGEVKLNKIVFKVIPDANTRALALEAGEIDMTGVDGFSRVSAEDISQLKNNPKFVVEKLPVLDNPSVQYIVVNYQKEPFTDLRVRKAIRHALNREEIDSVLGEGARTIEGPIPGEYPGFNPNIKDCYPYDLNKAKMLLGEAGWQDTDGDGILDQNGKPFKVTLKLHGQTPEWTKIANVFQAQLRKVGIDVKLEQLERGAHSDAVKLHDFEATFYSQMQYPMFYYSKRGWLNLYKNNELDQAFEQYFSSINQDQQQQAFLKTQEIIVDNVPMVLYYQTYHVFVKNKKVADFDLIPTSWNLIQNIWRSGIEG